MEVVLFVAKTFSGGLLGAAENKKGMFYCQRKHIIVNLIDYGRLQISQACCKYVKEHLDEVTQLYNVAFI